MPCRVTYCARNVLLAGLFVALAICPLAADQTNSEIPAHPNELKYAPLIYEPPTATKYRKVLRNGVVAFLAEDHELPLINVSLIIRTGQYLEPKGKEGLASMMASQMRLGGTTGLDADAFDEEVAFLAATISSGMGGTQASAGLNSLKQNADRALELFFDMLRNPRFQQDRIDLYKRQILQAMERRNDRTDGIQAREWNRLMYGNDHFSTSQSTQASIESITREDLLTFHKQYYHPRNFIFAVSGDFDSEKMVALLEAFLENWESPKMKVPPVPKPRYTPAPGLYLVSKAEVNQGRVTLGHLSTTRDNPDYYALSLMDDILGGGGFTSRITARVRSDEGLAYSARSSFGFGTYYDGVFQASFQSKSSTCAQAASIVLEEIERLRRQPVTSAELETAINAAVEIFPRYFATKAAVVGTFADDEYTGRKPDFWSTYRDRIRRVTTDEVLRVARQYLHPDQLLILAVGNVEEMLKGNPDRPEFSFEKLAQGKPIRRIPLPDPLTMVYPKN
ncbi:MAG: pitrilysin family protein [Acidobacteriota bacterium]